MKYRIFDKSGKQVSLLGFGAMRLPILNRDMSRIDEPLAVAMIRKAIDSGVNYVDTAYPYHGGKSEVAVGKALSDGYRDKVLLADKYPTWLTREGSDVSRYLTEQLGRLGTDRLDIYLIHSVNRENWELVRKCGVLAALEKEKARGRIKYIGFSFHDEIGLFKDVIDAYPWDLCQIQLNFMDEKFQAGAEGLKYAAAKGIQTVVMEPLKGGKLTDAVPPTVEDIWGRADVKRSPAEWAFKWLADFPEILTILSGMSKMEQVDENLRIFSEMENDNLTGQERKIISMAAAEYNRLIPYSCTACDYCQPCPSGIRIPGVIESRNEWEIYKNRKIGAMLRMWTPKGHFPSDCVKCGECEKKCPQKLPVMRIMKEAAELFE
ncbi:MAG: aldo/keto reductase [Clostridiales Family XIII bacterium]|jgi:predicted aldo/keto reductase-like oxidoreductase|nr:aldo/keto reductase [Clostridiales Family XIII bacterium]